MRVSTFASGDTTIVLHNLLIAIMIGVRVLCVKIWEGEGGAGARGCRGEKAGEWEAGL